MLSRLLVNVAQLKKNCLFLKKELKDKHKYEHLTATIKGNGYGHDALLVAPVCLANGIDALAVARMSEAVQLRQNIKGKYEVMLIGIVDEEDIPLAKKYDISIPVASLDQVKKMLKYDLKKVKVQYKLNTGMNRIGFKDPAELLKAYNLLQKAGVVNFGVYSHIYDNDNVEKTVKQFDVYEKLLYSLPNWKKIPYRHIRASESVDKLIRGIIPKRDWETNARPGCSVYGYVSQDPKLDQSFNCFQLVTKIVQVNKATTGETVGYDSTYTVKDKVEYIANLPIGWGDGLFRAFTGKKVYINGKLYPIVGKMAMDNTSVKVDETVKNGDTVYVFKDFKHACTFIDDPKDLANVIATIANLSILRVPRVPVKSFKK